MSCDRQIVLNQQILQGNQSRAAVGGEETEVTDFDEAFWKHVLEKTLNELFDRERAKFECSGVGLAVFKSNL